MANLAKRAAGLIVLSIAVYPAESGAGHFFHQNDREEKVQARRYDPKRMLNRSGVAHDAKENVVGIITVTEPKSFFKPDAKQFTWWGEFKPFRYWGRPKFEARWFTPSNKPAGVQEFYGEHCMLAKATLKPEGPVEPGKWRVEVYHQGEKIDSKLFVIYDKKAKTPVPAQPVEIQIETTRD